MLKQCLIVIRVICWAVSVDVLYRDVIYIPHIANTHSMVKGHSWAANRFAASQEIPRISRNPKVHYRTHKRPPPVSILGQPNPVHIANTIFYLSLIIFYTNRPALWSSGQESLTTNHDVPGSIPGSTVGIFSEKGGGIPAVAMVWVGW